MSRMVLAFTGMPGCGKGEAVTYLHDTCSVPVLRMGDLVWEEVSGRGLPLSPEHVGPVANEMRQLHGMDIWAKRAVERISGWEGGTVIIDGTRGPDEVSLFREEFGASLHVIAILSSPGVRFQRIMSRARKDDSLDREGFDQRDARELAWGVGRTIALADHVVVNEGTRERLREEIDTLYHSVIGE